MRISREEAHAFASAKKKLVTVKKGQCWLFCPFVPGATFHSVHWDHVQRVSVQCEGPGQCTYCPSEPNRKLHVPAIVRKIPYRAETAEGLKFPQDVPFQSDRWGAKIVELTENCFKPFDVPTKPDQLAIAWRPGPRQNGTLYFKWLDAILRGIPDDLEELSVEKVLPGVIGGRYVDAVERTPIDNSPISSIKHNLPYPTGSAEAAPGGEGNHGADALFEVPEAGRRRKAARNG